MSNIEEDVKKFVAIRNKKTEIAAEHKDVMGRINKALDTLKARIREKLHEAGAESVRTPAGTCYLSVKTSAKVDSRDAWIAFVEGNHAWDFVESRVNAKAVEAYLEETGELPPGVVLSRFEDIGVRRS
jgi:hypothetical protein